jgi:hypothetical protein
MRTIKEWLLVGIENRARRRLSELANAYVKAPGDQREAVQAGIEFERWLADSCRDVLE